MIKVVTNSLGSSDWITVMGHNDTQIFSGHRVGALELQEILNIVSPDGCVWVEVTDEQMEEGTYL